MVSFGQGVCILSTRFDCRERKKDFRLQRKFSPGTPCTPCTSSSNCSYATSSLLSLSSSASSDQGAVLSQIISPKKQFFRTFAAKRISLIFLGEPAVCECGPSGAELTRPHECPKMARWSNFCNFGGRNPNFLVSRSRPDILRDTESRMGERMLPPASPPSTVEKTKKSLPVLLEDPVSCPASR